MKLTDRDEEILNLLSRGDTDAEIAEALKVTYWTITARVKRLKDVCGCHTRTELAVQHALSKVR